MKTFDGRAAAMKERKQRSLLPEVQLTALLI
jgi:hypothetical protein